MKNLIFTFLLIAMSFQLATAKPAQNLLPSLAREFTPSQQNLFAPSSASDNDTYQIGSEWGKLKVEEKSLVKRSLVFQRAAKATAKLGGGTAFYLGEFAGEHVIATNYHVCKTFFSCSSNKANFTMLKRKFKLKKFLGSWPEIDLALITLTVKNDEDALLLSEVAGNFDFYGNIFKGQELLTIGHGVANNRRNRAMVANQDSDCVVFSEDGEFKLMADPDDLNPGPYKAWSFSNGCEVSHGDSGSAMVDRNTGKVLGIIWTGRIPKNKRVQDSSYLKELLKNGGEDVWKQLSYAVPAMKMPSVLKKVINSTNDKVKKDILSELLK